MENTISISDKDAAIRITNLIGKRSTREVRVLPVRFVPPTPHTCHLNSSYSFLPRMYDFQIMQEIHRFGYQVSHPQTEAPTSTPPPSSSPTPTRRPRTRRNHDPAHPRPSSPPTLCRELHPWDLDVNQAPGSARDRVSQVLRPPSWSLARAERFPRLPTPEPPLDHAPTPTDRTDQDPHPRSSRRYRSPTRPAHPPRPTWGPPPGRDENKHQKKKMMNHDLAASDSRRRRIPLRERGRETQEDEDSTRPRHAVTPSTLRPSPWAALPHTCRSASRRSPSSGPAPPLPASASASSSLTQNKSRARSSATASATITPDLDAWKVVRRQSGSTRFSSRPWTPSTGEEDPGTRTGTGERGDGAEGEGRVSRSRSSSVWLGAIGDRKPPWVMGWGYDNRQTDDPSRDHEAQEEGGGDEGTVVDVPVMVRDAPSSHHRCTIEPPPTAAAAAMVKTTPVMGCHERDTKSELEDQYQDAGAHVGVDDVKVDLAPVTGDVAPTTPAEKEQTREKETKEKEEKEVEEEVAAYIRRIVGTATGANVPPTAMVPSSRSTSAPRLTSARLGVDPMGSPTPSNANATTTGVRDSSATVVRAASTGRTNRGDVGKPEEGWRGQWRPLPAPPPPPSGSTTSTTSKHAEPHENGRGSGSRSTTRSRSTSAMREHFRTGDAAPVLAGVKRTPAVYLGPPPGTTHPRTRTRARPERDPGTNVVGLSRPGGESDAPEDASDPPAHGLGPAPGPASARDVVLPRVPAFGFSRQPRWTEDDDASTHRGSPPRPLPTKSKTRARAVINANNHHGATSADDDIVPPHAPSEVDVASQAPTVPHAAVAIQYDHVESRAGIGVVGWQPPTARAPATARAAARQAREDKIADARAYAFSVLDEVEAMELAIRRGDALAGLGGDHHLGAVDVDRLVRPRRPAWGFGLPARARPPGRVPDAPLDPAAQRAEERRLREIELARPAYPNLDLIRPRLGGAPDLARFTPRDGDEEWLHRAGPDDRNSDGDGDSDRGRGRRHRRRRHRPRDRHDMGLVLHHYSLDDAFAYLHGRGRGGGWAGPDLARGAERFAAERRRLRDAAAYRPTLEADAALDRLARRVRGGTILPLPARPERPRPGDLHHYAHTQTRSLDLDVADRHVRPRTNNVGGIPFGLIAGRYDHDKRRRRRRRRGHHHHHHNKNSNDDKSDESEESDNDSEDSLVVVGPGQYDPIFTLTEPRARSAFIPQARDPPEARGTDDHRSPGELAPGDLDPDRDPWGAFDRVVAPRRGRGVLPMDRQVPRPDPVVPTGGPDPDRWDFLPPGADGDEIGHREPLGGGAGDFARAPDRWSKGRGGGPNRGPNRGRRRSIGRCWDRVRTTGMRPGSDLGTGSGSVVRRGPDRVGAGTLPAVLRARVRGSTREKGTTPGVICSIWTWAPRRTRCDDAPRSRWSSRFRPTSPGRAATRTTTTTSTSSTVLRPSCTASRTPRLSRLCGGWCPWPGPRVGTRLVGPSPPPRSPTHVPRWGWTEGSCHGTCVAPCRCHCRRVGRPGRTTSRRRRENAAGPARG